MTNSVTDVITSYKAKNINTYRDLQYSLTPYLDLDFIEKRVFVYEYENERISVDHNRQICFKCKYMYFKSSSTRDFINHTNCIISLSELVENNIIYPFLLFINNRFVQWNMIKFYISNELYYIVCETDDPSWQYIFKNAESSATIKLPDGFLYKEESDDDKLFGFSINGTFSSNDTPISIINNSELVNCIHLTSNSVFNGYPIEDTMDTKYYPINTILFKNGLLDTTSEINFTGTMMTINNGKNATKDKLDVFIFRNKNNEPMIDNLRLVSQDRVSSFISRENQGISVPDYMNNLKEEFNLEMDRTKDYQTNINEAIQYITNYNQSLWKDAYLSNRKVTFESKTGQWVLDNTQSDGTIKLPVSHGEFTTECILMLVNGLLYKTNYNIKYDSGYCYISTAGITAKDNIEFIRFKDVSNISFDMIITEDDPYRNYDPNYINDNMVLFSTIPPTDDFIFPENGLQHFPVSYSLDKDSSGNVKIILTDSKYYGQPLKMVHNYRFYHLQLIYTSRSDNPYRIDLGNKLMYCNDYHRYLVFINGRRLGGDQYRLVLPVRSTTPFYTFELYVALTLKDGDVIDIIYTPSLMKDIYNDDSINSNGNIIIDKSKLTYGFDNELYIVWVNGKKVPNTCISNVDSDHIMINTDIGTSKNLAVTKYISDIDELTTAFKDATSIWDKIISDLTYNEIRNILELDEVIINDIDESIYSISTKSIMLELVRDHYMSDPNIDITRPFIYDYTDVDDIAIDGYDSGNNIIIEAANANTNESISGVKRPYP